MVSMIKWQQTIIFVHRTKCQRCGIKPYHTKCYVLNLDWLSSTQQFSSSLCTLYDGTNCFIEYSESSDQSLFWNHHSSPSNIHILDCLITFACIFHAMPWFQMAPYLTETMNVLILNRSSTSTTTEATATAIIIPRVWATGSMIMCIGFWQKKKYFFECFAISTH